MWLRVFVFHLIPHIKSAYQIGSYVRMDIKRGMYFNLNIGIYIAVGVIRALSPKKILNVDLSLLKRTEFFHRFQN